ncbi:hypothetical protein Sango_3089800 [Sesamum angolense]|uniref:Bet v I/Major latex protein domain-containing protein n=1 Tax=Sesamum angolense TaxID=2727404 RepID=A0AAE1T9R2_9LAMI|nr:hypothetical protein Sango_3089800 [Sesamum angolense]
MSLALQNSGPGRRWLRWNHYPSLYGSRMTELITGVPGPAWYKQKYLVVDDVRRVKLAPTIEGGVLEQGFKSYTTRLEAIEKKGKRDECIMIGTVEYVLEDESAFPLVASSIEGLYDIMKTVADYVIKHHNTTN